MQLELDTIYVPTLSIYLSCLSSGLTATC